jgi:hypothetical protein
MERHMIKRVVCFCVLLIGVITHVQAEQGCPYPSSIQFVQGHFQSADRKGSWRSPKVDRQDYVDVFIGAVFMPGKGQERENGYLEKCIYRTGKGDTMALRYEVSKAVGSMSLTHTLFWHPASDPFGLDVYICQDSQPDNCSFTTKP